MYETGDGVPVDYPMAKRYYDKVATHGIWKQDTYLAISVALTRLYMRALYAMVRGDVTARRLFQAHLPSLPTLWRRRLPLDTALELVLFLTGLCALIALRLWRRYVVGRLAEAQALLRLTEAAAA